MAKGKPRDPLDPSFLIEHAERLTTSNGGGRRSALRFNPHAGKRACIASLVESPESPDA